MVAAQSSCRGVPSSPLLSSTKCTHGEKGTSATFFQTQPGAAYYLHGQHMVESHTAGCGSYNPNPVATNDMHKHKYKKFEDATPKRRYPLFNHVNKSSTKNKQPQQYEALPKFTLLPAATSQQYSDRYAQKQHRDHYDETHTQTQATASLAPPLSKR